MKRTILAASAALVLALAGVATAAALTRHVNLRAGACVTLAKTRVCAAKAATVIHTRVLTVTSPAPAPVTVTVTTPAAPPPPATTTPTPSAPVSKDFSGNGDTAIAPFSTPVGETLSWTSSWPAGCSISDCNGDIGIFDNGDHPATLVDGSNLASGSTYLQPGSHTLSVVDESGSSWTIHIG